jgi:hypothetical protein
LRDPVNSFWNPDESESLDSVESDLIRLWHGCGHGWAVYVMRIATHGIREYYVYAGGTADFSSVVARMRTLYPSYRVDFEESADPTWKRYTGFLPVA